MNINVPFQFNARGRTNAANDADHVRQMIEQLLFTNAGERVNRPDFGSGLMQLVFSPNSPELAATLQFTAQAALQRWLGDVIELHSLQVLADDSALRIDIRYVIRRTGEQQKANFSRSV